QGTKTCEGAAFHLGFKPRHCRCGRQGNTDQRRLSAGSYERHAERPAIKPYLSRPGESRNACESEQKGEGSPDVSGRSGSPQCVHSQLQLTLSSDGKHRANGISRMPWSIRDAGCKNPYPATPLICIS